jgi:hypothetical protein
LRCFSAALFLGLLGSCAASSPQRNVVLIDDQCGTASPEMQARATALASSTWTMSEGADAAKLTLIDEGPGVWDGHQFCATGRSFHVLAAPWDEGGHAARVVVVDYDECAETECAVVYGVVEQ